AVGRDLLGRRFDVGERLVERHLLAERPAAGHVVGAVAELDATLDPVEQRRRDDDVALPGIIVAHRADVAVHPEDLLHDDQRAARLARRIGPVHAETMPVGGGTLYDLAHALLPILAVPPDAGTPCPEARARNRSKPHLLADRDDSEKGRSGCEATEIPIFAENGGEQGPGIL